MACAGSLDGLAGAHEVAPLSQRPVPISSGISLVRRDARTCDRRHRRRAVRRRNELPIGLSMYRVGSLRRVFRARGKARWHQRLRGHKGICADSRGWISMGDRLARGRSAVPGRRAAPPPRAGGSSPVGVPSAATPSQLSDRYAIRTRGNSRRWPRAGKGVRAQLAKPRGASLVVVFLASKCAAERALRTGASALAARSIDEFVEVKCWFSHARERRGGSIGGLNGVS